METSRFDSLVRALGEGGTTRRALTGLFGGALLAALPLAGGAKKKKKKKKKKCKPEPVSTTCAGKCGSVTNNCKQVVACGSCACKSACGVCFTCQAGPNSPGTCVADAKQVGDPCGAAGQVCQANGTCACANSACANPTPVCGAQTCEACTSHTQCQAAGKGDICCNGSCFAGNCCDNSVCGNPTPICTQHTCSACTSTSQCATKEICDSGSCAVCDVCASGCTYSSPQEAIEAGYNNGDPSISVKICPGTYSRIYKHVHEPDATLIGAGDGADPASNTILDDPGTNDPDPPDWVARFEGGTSTLRGVRITGGTGGGLLNNTGTTLHLTDCTIFDNSSLTSVPGGGDGGGITNAGTLLVTNVTVAENKATIRGAGIFNFGSDGATIAFSGVNLISGNVLEEENAPGSAIFNQGNTPGVITGLNTVAFENNDPETDQCHGCPT